MASASIRRVSRSATVFATCESVRQRLAASWTHRAMATKSPGCESASRSGSDGPLMAEPKHFRASGQQCEHRPDDSEPYPDHRPAERVGSELKGMVPTKQQAWRAHSAIGPAPVAGDCHCAPARKGYRLTAAPSVARSSQ